MQLFSIREKNSLFHRPQKLFVVVVVVMRIVWQIRTRLYFLPDKYNLIALSRKKKKNRVFVLANGASSFQPWRTSANQQRDSFTGCPYQSPSITLSLDRIRSVGPVLRPSRGRCLPTAAHQVLVVKKHWVVRPQMRPLGMEKQRSVTLQATVQPDGLLEPSGWKHMHMCLCGRVV